MSKHLADHCSEATPSRAAQYLCIARSGSQTMWHRLWQSQTSPATNRRMVEFLRIARQKD